MTQVSSAETSTSSSVSRKAANDFFRRVGTHESLAPKIDPIQDLIDMSLPSTYLDWMKPIFERLECQIEYETIIDPDSSDEHRYTLLTKDGSKRQLLLIPDKILAEFSRVVKAVLVDVLRLLRGSYPSASLFIIHESRPNLVYRNSLEDWAEKESFAISFVRLGDLDELEAQSPQFQDQYLTREFSLKISSDEAGQKKKNISSSLPFEDLEKVANIIAKLPNFQDDTTARRLLVEARDLDGVVGDINYDQPPKLVAWLIARRLLKGDHIQVHGKKQHPFRMLLSSVTTLFNLSNDAQTFFDEILNSYDFGEDPG